MQQINIQLMFLIYLKNKINPCFFKECFDKKTIFFKKSLFFYGGVTNY